MNKAFFSKKYDGRINPPIQAGIRALCQARQRSESTGNSVPVCWIGIWRMIKRNAPVGLVSLLFMMTSFATGQSVQTGSFMVEAGSLVSALAVQVDGKILVGGYFTNFADQSRHHLARLNADGTLDESFDPGANGNVYSLAVQSDGKVLVGGEFTIIAGQARPCLARINEDGTMDTSFNPGAVNGDWPSPYVDAITIQTDGKILVSGYFTHIAGLPRNCIARLHADGTLDTSFNPEIPGDYPVVFSMALQSDGKILAGGIYYTNTDSLPHASLARFNVDGTRDTGFNPLVEGSMVLSLVVQADDKILVGGKFTNLAGIPRHSLARLNADGTLDMSFNPGESTTNYFNVNALMLQTDGKMVVGGSFLYVGGQQRDSIARFNADGTLDNDFNFEGSISVTSLAMQPDGQILVGRDFFSTKRRFGVARIANSSNPSQNLICDHSGIVWQRGGSSPEVRRATFEHSVDGFTWSALGEGVRIPGGWQLSGISIPPASFIRARGFVTGGCYNGSTWIIESVMAPPGGTVFSIRPTNGLIAIQVSGELGRQYQLESAPVLGDSSAWKSLFSFMLTNNPQLISDPFSTNTAQRYYRLKSITQ